jgi:hypothetical protein
MYSDPDDDGFVSIPECAERMGLSVEQVWDLIESHALAAQRYGGWGEILCQPAILSGATSGPVTPPPDKPKRRLSRK